MGVGVLIGVTLAVVGGLLYRYLDNLASPRFPRLSTYRRRARNLLVRFRMMPVDPLTVRHYQLGHAAAIGYKQSMLDLAVEAQRMKDDQIQALKSEAEETFALVRLVAKAEPHHLPTLRKKARRLLDEGPAGDETKLAAPG